MTSNCEEVQTGTDDDGLVWSQFEADALAGEEPGTCAICGEVLTEGWHCLDGGEEVCKAHVVLADEAALPAIAGEPRPDAVTVAIPA